MPTERPPLLGEVIPTFADRGCCVVNATDLPGRILGFLDRELRVITTINQTLTKLIYIYIQRFKRLKLGGGQAYDRSND
jgi:hypothetical protein